MSSGNSHLRLGAAGEALAAAHLRRDGMRILDRNWRWRHGELDIVARHRRHVVFCEVKTRRSTRHGTPMEAVDADKADRIKRSAAAWRRAHRACRCRRRFDVVCVFMLADGAALIDHRTGVL